MSDSIWKKDLSFKRKPKAEAQAEQPPAELPAATTPKQSIWKKDLSLKKKDTQVEAAPIEAAPEAAVPKQSIWKKDLSLKKKDKQIEAAVEAAPGAAVPKQSIWKKDLSLKKKDTQVEAAPVEAAPAAPGAAAPKQSIWKKDLTLSRKKQDREVDRLAAEAAHAVSDAFPAVALEPPSELLPTRIAEAAVAAMPDPPEPERVEPEPAFEPAPPLAPVAPISPLSAAIVSASADEVVPVEPVAFEPVAFEPAPVPDLAYEPAPLEAVAYEPAPVEPWSEPEPVAEPAVEPWLAEPELPPAAEAPVVLHPPVPAAELPPIETPNVPFWKKDLSLSRSPKAPKQPKEKKEKAPKPAGGPFWKKELSFKRTPKVAVEAAADDATEPMPAVAKSPPFWKRELGVPKLAKPSRSSRRSGTSGKSSNKAKRFVGLKIGSSQLAAASISNNGVAELLQIAREPLDHGIVIAGELREPDALAAALKAFFLKNKLPRKNVRLGIASNRIGVRIFDVVGIDDDKQLANAIQFRAQEALPIPLDEAVLDYRVLENTVDDQGQAVKRVLLVVAYKDLVDRYVSACHKAGITLVGIDLEAFALLRSLAAPAEGSSAATVAVSIGHDRSTFAVTNGRICDFTRVLEWGGWALNVALARALDTAPSEVEGVKRALSLDSGAPVEGLTPEQNAIALDAVRRQLQSFARELVSSLQFYQNQAGSLAIGSVVITGGTAHMSGLAEELERLIGVRVEIGNPLARLKVAKRVLTPEPLGSLAVAIGLGIED